MENYRYGQLLKKQKVEFLTASKKEVKNNPNIRRVTNTEYLDSVKRDMVTLTDEESERQEKSNAAFEKRVGGLREAPHQVTIYVSYSMTILILFFNCSYIIL